MRLITEIRQGQRKKVDVQPVTYNKRNAGHYLGKDFVESRGTR